MKRGLIALTFLVVLQPCLACDICGCSTGAYYISPWLQKNFLSARYSYRTYFSRMHDDPASFSDDRYQTVELVGGFGIGARWHITAFLPYNINYQRMERHPHEASGVGDITLITHYRLHESQNSALSAGVGLKLPTGRFQPGLVHHPSPSANVEPGTGSLDLVWNLAGMHRWEAWSIHGNANYKLNSTAKGFRFGNQLHLSALLARSLGKKSVFNPFAGLQFESLAGNLLDKQPVDHTGGRALLGTAGCQLRFRNIFLDFNFQLPVTQNISDNQTRIISRGMVQMGFTF